MNKNCLIFGGGSKFGLSLSKKLSEVGYDLYNVTSNPSDSSKDIVVDWHKCDFIFVERLLSNLPVIDLVIFNQNFCQIPEMIDLTVGKLRFWKQNQNWIQSHFINSILPCQVLSTLSLDGKFTDSSLAVWMLSKVILDDHDDKHLGYRAQKRLNKDIIKNISKNNPGRFMGFDPGVVDPINRDLKAQTLVEYLITDMQKGLFYQFNKDYTAVIEHGDIT